MTLVKEGGSVEPLRADDPDRIGHYHLLARLGAGGMGVVYLGRSPGGLLVAVKVIWARYASSVEYRARFRREVTAARTVSGAFTAPVLDADPDAAEPWLAAAYLPGLSLREAVAAFGRFPVAAVRALAAGLVEALVDIHRSRLTHRDLKPGNIILTVDGPKVIDFGIARPEDATAITRVGTGPGTPGFMSPEQAAGGDVGPASDVFSFGTVLAYAATAEEPFRADLSVITDRWLRGLIRNCRRQEPKLRPTTVELLAKFDRTVVAHDTAWLPTPVVEEIDRRTAEARRLAEVTTVRPHTGRTQPAMADPAQMAEPTVEPEVTGEAGLLRRLNRREALLGGGAVLALAGGAAGVVALLTNRDPKRPAGAPDSTTSTSLTTPSRTSPIPSSPPPLAVSRWKAQVSDYYPDLFAAGGLVLAHEQGVIHALDPATGTTRWTHDSLRVDLLDVVGDDVFLVDVTHEPAAVVLVRAASGTDRWTYPGPPDKAPMYPVTGGSLACFGYDSVTALNLSDGQLRWTAPVNAELGIAVDGDLVVAVNRTTVSALDAGTGGIRWTYQADFAHYPQACYGLVFICDKTGTVHAIHADTGLLAWRQTIDSTVYASFGFRLGGGLVYFGTANGDVRALRAATGEQVWSRELRSAAPRTQWNALGVTDDMLYVGCADGNVYALDRTDGRTMWSYPADVTVRTSAPVTVAGLVFIGTGDGFVEALSPPGGG